MGKKPGIACSLYGIVFILASIFFFTTSIKKEASIVLQGSPEIVVQKLVAGRHDLIPEDYIRVIEEDHGSPQCERAFVGLLL